MKPLLFSLFTLLFAFAGRSLAADTLVPIEATVAGTILQTGTNSQGDTKTIASPSTTREFLKLLGYPEVKPKETAYFLDSTTSQYILASKDGNTVYGAIIDESGADTITWDTPKKRYYVKQISMINGSLTGNVTGSAPLTFFSRGPGRDTGRFILCGTLLGVPTILTGSYTVSWKSTE
jgi:hypothetical protein